MSSGLDKRKAAFLKDRFGGARARSDQASRRANVLARQQTAKDETYLRARRLARAAETVDASAATPVAALPPVPPPAVPPSPVPPVAATATAAGAGAGMDLSSGLPSGTGKGGGGGTGKGKGKGKSRRDRRKYGRAAATPESAAATARYFASELSTAEWLLDVPHDLNGAGVSEEGWLVKPRPEGKTVLVMARKGVTTARDKNGLVVARFASCLPSGSPATQGASGDVTILEGVLTDGALYVMDMMCWKGFELFGCSAEFRQFWIMSKLSEIDVGAGGGDKFALRSVPSYECDNAGLRAAVTPVPGMPTDGVLLYHKAAKYDPGPNPTVLRWRDGRCSRFMPPAVGVGVGGVGGVALPKQQVCLQVGVAGALQTLEGTTLGTAPADFLASQGVAAGGLLTFSIDAAAETDSGPGVTSAVFVGKAGKHRLFADSWSKILFDSLARRGQCVPFEALLAGSAVVGGGDAGVGVGVGVAPPGVGHEEGDEDDAGMGVGV